MAFKIKTAAIWAGLVLLLAANGCVNDAPVAPPKPIETPKPVKQVGVPDFNGDSAYAYVKKQVAFGPRVPNTEAHKKCAAWMVAEFKRFGLTVIEQKFQAPYYKGGIYNGNNIIAQYRPELTKRICIAAHWDSRAEADKDTKNPTKPIDGADDGASGIGVLLELARTLHQTPVDIGVDFICFDLEDNGDDDGGESETWCLGSQYWSKNLHKAGYFPYYAILLDMVGGKNAKFKKEGISMEVAPKTVELVWRIAQQKGYSDLFVDEQSPGITDDHYFVVQNARIPMIDIISMPGDGEHRFPTYHHTHADNMSVIDKTVLKKVGEVMTAVIYGTYNGTY